MLSLLATALLSQCATGITDNTQSLCGHKHAIDGLSIWTGVSLRGGAMVEVGDGAAFRVRSYVPQNDLLTPSHDFDTYFARGNDGGTARLVAFRNAGQIVASVDSDGKIPAMYIEVGGGHSGELGVVAYPGRYLALAGRHPNAYWYPGKHGAVQAQNEHPMNFGFPFEVYNAIDSYGNVTTTHEAHKLLFGARGQIATMDNTLSTNLPVCDGKDNFPPSDEPTNRGTGPLCDDPPADGGHLLGDGGTCWDWYRAVGPPRAIPGAVFVFVADVGEGCQCAPALYDGGLSSSWRKLSDRSECKP